MRYFRNLTFAAAMLGCGAIAAVAQETYPEKPITFLVPYAAGANGDIVARILANALQPELGQPLVVENRPGAGGNIGAAEVAHEDADGYTIMLATNTHAINQTLYPDAGYELRNDFAPVSMISSAPMVLLVNAQSDASSVEEFLNLAKDGQLSYSSGGNGASGHLFMELFSQQAGIELAHIPYPGVAAAVTDLLAGRVDSTFSTTASTAEVVKDGQLRALAIAAPSRSDIMPDVPTLTESGIADMEDGIWQGIVVPDGTSQDRIDILNTAIANVLAQDEVKTQLAQQGLDARPSTPADFGTLIENEIARWNVVIERAGITLE